MTRKEILKNVEQSIDANGRMLWNLYTEKKTPEVAHALNSLMEALDELRVAIKEEN